MNPRTPYQKKVVALSESLPPITAKQYEWAKEHCHSLNAYGTHRKKWCSHCGKDFEIAKDEIDSHHLTCPHCGKKLKNEKCRKRMLSERFYFTIITTHKSFQVCRHFMSDRTIRQGGEVEYDLIEVVQNWIDDKGKESIISRPTYAFSHYCDQWLYDRDMELRIKKPRYYKHYTKYDIAAYFIYPKVKLLPKVRRNGFTRRVDGVPVNCLISYLLKDKEAEMLVKNKQYDLMRYKWQRGYDEFEFPYQHSIKVANRHKYIVKDASMWRDYLDLLDYFGLDTHNPRYVCVDDVTKEHNRLLERKNMKERKERLEKERKEAVKWEEQYEKDKGKYFGICFGNDSIVITVIKSVSEMAEEGSAMHHCVYGMGYYKKADSLILSAKDKDGNRIETIEVNLRTFEVIQSRGVCNQNTPQHDTIVDLVKRNIHLIRNAS